MFFEGLTILCLIIGVATIYSMVTMNPFVYSAKWSIIVIGLAAGSWFTAGGLLLMSLLVASFDNLFNGLVLFVPAVGIILLNWRTPPKVSAVHGEVLTVATVNVLVTNVNEGRMISSDLSSTDPDIIFMQEYDIHIGQGMEKFLERYDYVFMSEVGPDGIPDVVIYSKLPLENKRTHYVNERPMLLADVEHDGRVVTLVCVHTASPTTPERSEIWFEELNAYRRLFKVNTPLIVAGSFNATISHAPYRAMLKDSFLNDFTALLNTWSTQDSVPEFLHLDHILCSVDFTMVDRPVKHTGEGSDHSPVTVKVALL